MQDVSSVGQLACKDAAATSAPALGSSPREHRVEEGINVLPFSVTSVTWTGWRVGQRGT